MMRPEKKHKFEILRRNGAEVDCLGHEYLTLEEAKFKALHEEVVCHLVEESPRETVLTSENQSVRITQVRNGYLLQLNYWDGDGHNYTETVVQEQEDEVQDFFTDRKQRVLAFMSLVEILENLFGVDCPDEEQYYLDYKLKKVPKRE